MATTPTAPPVADTPARRLIQVQGIVQGVGFRPFVYNLAHSLALTGHVFNTSAGVTIEIEGPNASLDTFLAELQSHPPALAQLGPINISDIPPVGDTNFTILHSHAQPGDFALISPDTGTCDACLADISDPANRRFGYPFTNCTHCGPRYTILQDIPYDRANTTMSVFPMCPACAAEYADPTNRRFHAQPNACPVCGPSLALLNPTDTLDDDAFSNPNNLEVLHQSRQLLLDGKILAIRGLGGFLLACDATNESAVAELRRRKRRPAKPFALMARDLTAIRDLCEVSPTDEAALQNLRRPMVVLPRRPNAPLAASLAPGNNTLGVMLPYTPLHYLLFSDTPAEPSAFPALVMTSGNLSEEPIVTDNAEALDRLAPIADHFLFHNRGIFMRVDDSIVRTFEGRERVLRRARGYVPQTIDLATELPEILAVGAELKNSFCLTKGTHAILSQHIGDLENFETEEFFRETLARMTHLFKVHPQAIAHDLHPNYRSTRIALALPIERKVAIQHHHAHIASCMAENHLHGDVIGVAFDGTGYGTDARIWGGEFLIANRSTFTRAAHLRYIPMPGSDAAVRQPWRMALSYLRDAFGDDIPTHLPFFQTIPPAQLNLVNNMLARQFQTVETSSIGRLFDAVAALLNLATEVTFEAQAAIALETIADPTVTTSYPYDFLPTTPLAIDLRPTIRAIVDDLSASRPTSEISARFHNTICALIVECCRHIANSTGLAKVCLSGGTFQNHVLLQKTVVELRRSGLAVFLHATVPANDGGIALGQAVIAAELLRTTS